MGVTAKADRLPDPTPEMILSHLDPSRASEFEKQRAMYWRSQFQNQMPQSLQRQATLGFGAFNMPEYGGSPDLPEVGALQVEKMPIFEPEYYTPFNKKPSPMEDIDWYHQGKFPEKGTQPIHTPDSAEDLVSKIIDNPRGEP